MLQSIQLWLTGKKTYLAALAAIIAAVTAYAEGTTDAWQTVMAIGGAIVAATLRHGVTTEAKTVVDEIRPPLMKP
jgi:type IV secretory pathway VirB2 component (pilin)